MGCRIVYFWFRRIVPCLFCLYSRLGFWFGVRLDRIWICLACNLKLFAPLPHLLACRSLRLDRILLCYIMVNLIIIVSFIIRYWCWIRVFLLGSKSLWRKSCIGWNLLGFLWCFLLRGFWRFRIPSIAGRPGLLVFWKVFFGFLRRLRILQFLRRFFRGGLWCILLCLFSLLDYLG